MRILKIFVGTLFILILGAVLGLWYVWAQLTRDSNTPQPVPTAQIDPPSLQIDAGPDDDTPPEPEPTVPEDTPGALTDAAPEALSVSPDQLTPEQRTLAEKFGIDPAAVTITPGMIRCAEDALGSERLAEITAGDTPGPLEALRILPCINN